jgi:hypothetical protein
MFQIKEIDMRDMRFKISMAPTPEQEAVLKRVMHERAGSQDLASGDGFGYIESIMTLDEALAMFQAFKNSAG